MDNVITGGCLCGGVRYEVRGPFLRANYCHCSRCRRHSGSTFGIQGRVKREQLRLLQGRDLVREYRPEQGAVKAFCSVCGSNRDAAGRESVRSVTFTWVAGRSG